MATYNIGEIIKKRREELGMSQDELAKKLGYKSRSSIYKIEIGENDIPHSKIDSFAAALKVSHGYLLGWDDNVSQTTIGFDDEIIDLDTGLSYTEEQWEELRDSFSIKIEQHQNIEFKCFLTDTQKELLISMIKSWGVECYERKEGKNV